MACEHPGHEVHFMYPSSVVACVGLHKKRRLDVQLAVVATNRYQVTCVDCKIAIAEDSEHCWRCNQPDPNQPEHRFIRHTCDPAATALA